MIDLILSVCVPLLYQQILLHVVDKVLVVLLQEVNLGQKTYQCHSEVASCEEHARKNMLQEIAKNDVSTLLLREAQQKRSNSTHSLAVTYLIEPSCHSI